LALNSEGVLMQCIAYLWMTAHRMHAGQAIVQMAYSPNSRLEYAVKFFIARDAFEQERALYCGHNPLGRFLPQVFFLSARGYVCVPLFRSVACGRMCFRSLSHGLDVLW
jgi:hypothetical protein